MTTLLRIETETLPRLLVLDPPVSDAEFEALCRENDNIRLERTKEGVVRMNFLQVDGPVQRKPRNRAPIGNWQATHDSGRVFDSSTGFRLPDGSTLSPDASCLSGDRLLQLPKGALRGFPCICPDFVIELRSESDALQELKDKMNDWIANGAQLAWLIDPNEQQVLVFRQDQSPELVSGDRILGEGPVRGFVLDLTRVWKCYQD
jgi:Uma2 family endonuclease